MMNALDVAARRLAAFAIAVPTLVLAMPGAGAAPPPTSRAAVKVHMKDGRVIPLFEERSGGVPIATVGQETLTVADLRDALALAHAEHEVGATAGKKKDPRSIVERLIETRLLVAEARAMGIDELPELRASVEAYREQALRAMVEERATKDVKADAFELERRYRAATVEWKQRSLLFTKREEAQAAADALRAGKPFDDVAAPLLAAGTATGGGPAQFTPATRMLTPVVEALRRVGKGEVTSPVELTGGWAVILVEDVRYREDEPLKQQLEQQMVEAQRVATLKAYAAKLKKKYAKVDTALLKRLDYHAKKPGFEALLKDQRVLARVTGEAPITVGALTAEIAKEFYHGFETALREKKINGKKEPKLEAMLTRRLFLAEARAQKIAGSEEYARRVAEWERNVVFGTFLQRVVAPEVKVTEEDARKYFAQNAAAYTFPAIYRLDALAFAEAKDAEAALKRLQSGTDFKWLKANAERQIPEGERTLDFSTPLASTGLPPALARSLEGARKGDYRLHVEDGRQYYVVNVSEVTGPEVQPFESAQGKITERLFGERVTAAIKDWAAKLREHHKVEVYITLVE